MNVLKIFRKRSQSAPLKPTKDDLAAPAPGPVKNLLLLIECSREELDASLGMFKAYFGEENIIKATSDGTVFYIGLQDRHKDTFIKKMLEEPFRCKTFTLGFVTEPGQSIDRFKSLAETNNITELLLRRFAPESLHFFMDDATPAPERRFSAEELEGGTGVQRRPSVLGLFDEAGGESKESLGGGGGGGGGLADAAAKSKSMEALPRKSSDRTKSPEPSKSPDADKSKVLRKRRSVSHLLSGA